MLSSLVVVLVLIYWLWVVIEYILIGWIKIDYIIFVDRIVFVNMGFVVRLIYEYFFEIFWVFGWWCFFVWFWRCFGCWNCFFICWWCGWLIGFVRLWIKVIGGLVIWGGFCVFVVWFGIGKFWWDVDLLMFWCCVYGCICVFDDCFVGIGWVIVGWGVVVVFVLFVGCWIGVLLFDGCCFCIGFCCSDCVV